MGRCGFCGLSLEICRSEECKTIYFAAAGQRQFTNRHERRGQHILRQLLLQKVTQVGFTRRLTCLRHEVSDKLLVSAIDFSGDNYAFTHLRMTGEDGFNLAQFDAKTANFYLKIFAALESNAAVGEAAAEIAGAVDAIG